MNKTIKFDLSVKSIENAQKEINDFLKTLQTRVNKEFINLSLEWIKQKAIEYLSGSGYGSAITSEISASFVKNIKGNIGTLIVDHEKGAYVEFGVGMVAKNQPHPKANDVNYEYDVDSDAKFPISRRWQFHLDDGEVMNIKYADATQISYKSKDYVTQGSTGALFMYNAIMDFANNGEVIKSLYNQAMINCLGG